PGMSSEWSPGGWRRHSPHECPLIPLASSAQYRQLSHSRKPAGMQAGARWATAASGFDTSDFITPGFIASDFMTSLSKSFLMDWDLRLRTVCVGVDAFAERATC